MNTLKLTGRLLLGTAMVAAVSQGVFAQDCPPNSTQETDTFSDDFGPEIGNWMTETLSVPKWTPPVGEDPTRVTLIRVEVSLCAQVDGTANFTNEDDDPCTLNYNVTASIDATPQDGGSPIGMVTIDAGTTDGPFDLDPMESGSDAFDSGIQCQIGDPLVFTSGPDLAWFIANGGDNTVLIDHQGVTTSTSNGCGVIDFTTDIFSVVTLRVDYIYCVETTETKTTPEGGCRCTGPSPHYRRPGSLLLFPEFDNQQGAVTLITVTNTDCTRESNDVDIEYIYIDETNCAEFNRTETLTPCDTLTLLTNFHNPNQERGFVYVFAKDGDDNSIVFNHLIGNQLVISGLDVFDYSVNPVVFRGIGEDGDMNDIDGDDIRDLDGQEYEQAPDTITIPRFLGQDLGKGGLIQSQLVLIALSGGSEFTTRIDCLVYNDNEQEFSFDHTFYCWDKPFLLDVAPATSNTFLQSTDTDPNEIIGATTREAGWICCDGAVATSTQETIVDPAFYMVLVERVGTFGVADLPFECGMQDNGALLPRDILGDGDPTPMNGDNQ